MLKGWKRKEQWYVHVSNEREKLLCHETKSSKVRITYLASGLEWMWDLEWRPRMLDSKEGKKQVWCFFDFEGDWSVVVLQNWRRWMWFWDFFWFLKCWWTWEFFVVFEKIWGIRSSGPKILSFFVQMNSLFIEKGFWEARGAKIIK